MNKLIVKINNYINKIILRSNEVVGLCFNGIFFFVSNNSILLQLFMNFVYSIDMTAQVMRPTGALKVHTLDWQSSSRTVAERFQKLFELAEWADCKFLVGSEEPRTVSTKI